MKKQIFAALEIADHEIRLIIGEFFNTRFNIIKVERVTCNGFENNKIKDEDEIVKNISKAIDNASKTVGAKIEKVLLCIPSSDVKLIPLKVNIKINSIDHMVTQQDVVRAREVAMKKKISNDYVVVQAAISKYTVNGISTRRLPINEICEEILVDIDLLCAKKENVFNLVSCVEKAGLGIIEICLDMYAIAKEAALFEQTMDHNVIVLKVERQATTLGLISKGRLVGSDVYLEGLDTWISSLSDKYGLPIETSARLLKYNARLDLENYKEHPVYIWANHGETFTLSEKELAQCVKENVDYWIKQIELACSPILKAGKTSILIVGEGGELQGLDKILQNRLNVEVNNYSPETLGVRYSGYSATLGLFFAYKDNYDLDLQGDCSVDMVQFQNTVTYKEIPKDDDEESITKKLKGMLFEARK